MKASIPRKPFSRSLRWSLEKFQRNHSKAIGPEGNISAIQRLKFVNIVVSDVFVCLCAGRPTMMYNLPHRVR